mgnify:CR=1 FL=1
MARGLNAEQADASTAHPQISWVIAGGESGPKHREHQLEWSRSLRDQCVAAGVPFAGLKVKQGPIAILYLEHAQSDLVAKIRAAARGMGVDPATLPMISIIHGVAGM